MILVGSLDPRQCLRYYGDEKANMASRPDFSTDPPLSREQLESLRRRLSEMSMTALFDAYYAAWTRCKMERDGRPPRARFVQELVTAWRVLRKLA